MLENSIIIIPARLASTRLPEKVLREIDGKPMIQHVYDLALQTGAAHVLVACDDAKIMAGLEGKSVLTDVNHSCGSDRIFEALKIYEAQENRKFDYVINLQGDMPVFDPDIISDLCELLSSGEVDIATLANKITKEVDKENPNIVKPVLSFYGARKARALYFTRAACPHGSDDMYHHIGIYGFKRESLEQYVNMEQSELEKCEKLEQLRALEAGMRIDVAVVDDAPVGVDTEAGLEKVRKIIES